MAAAWWADLSDDELLARLAHGSVVADDEAQRLADLVRHRDDEWAAATITAELAT